MKLLYKLLFLITLLFLFSCNKDNSNYIHSPKKGGVSISFDDAYITSWYNSAFLLSKYHWKATFDVTQINKLTEHQINQLFYLQKQGYEIAGHGLLHLHALKFVSTYGMSAYLEQEIFPMIEIFNKKSLRLRSFVYPYSSRNSKIDSTLFNYFSILRTGTEAVKTPSEQVCFFNNSRLVTALQIDDNVARVDDQYILDLLKYAKENNKILLLFGHKIVEGDSNYAYQVRISRLKKICDYVDRNNMKFYNLSDLAKLIQ